MLDVLSRARLLLAGMIELVAGAVYVDTERESGASKCEHHWQQPATSGPSSKYVS